jgi:ADP-heptose:LPS heptosyltransferase
MIRKRGSPFLHYLDRYAGIPAVAVLGLMRPRRELPARIERFGFLRTAAIGDTVLISGAIADLRKAFPASQMVFFAGPSNFEVARMLYGIDEVVELPIVNFAASIRRIRSTEVDVMIDFGQWPRLDALLTLFSGALYTIGFQTKGQHRHFGYDATVQHSSNCHEIENFRSLVGILGVDPCSPPRLGVPISDNFGEANYAVFHLWPGGRRKKLKQWPAERWLELIEGMACRDLGVVLTGGPEDRCNNNDIITRVRLPVREFVKNAAGISLADCAGLIARSRLVVSVDTGVMHMASALGVPLVALHGPTSSKRWGPISECSIPVDSPLEGSGYINLGWEQSPGPLACMECISLEAVREACRSIKTKQVESSR